MVGSLAHINRQGRLIEHVGELPESKFVEFLDHSAHELNALLDALQTARGQEILHSRVAQTDGSAPLMIELPITKGIAGIVARPGQPLNIPDAYFHPMFNLEWDQRTGYRTCLILCLPILDREGGLFGVVRLLTKRGGLFTAEDATRLRKFLRPLGTILDACRRLAHLGQTYAYA